MKTLLSKITGVAASIFFSATMFAQTSGTLTVVFTPTVPAGSTFYSGTTTKQNTLAAWIQSSTGTFIKTNMRYWGGATSNTGDHLPTWVSKSGSNITSATTGATKSGFASNTFTWNATNVSGAVVADGNYQLVIEDCWNHGTTPNGIYTSTVSFVKGPTASTVTPTATSWLTGVSVIWTPSAVGVNEINAVNPALSVYPNPTQGLFTVDFKNANTIKVFNTLGAVVYEEKIEQTTGSKQIDLTRFVNGVYFVNVSNGTNSSNQKIILNK